MLQCSVQFSYDRFFTKFNYEDSNHSVLNTPNGTVNSNDQLKRGLWSRVLGGLDAITDNRWDFDNMGGQREWFPTS